MYSKDSNVAYEYRLPPTIVAAIVVEERITVDERGVCCMLWVTRRVLVTTSTMYW